ncbi:MAG: hypothetical protein GC160_02980 [Acidobacteria bacterium]|nr:hypothetical protein [Acidobacteriota bacterium]
MALSPVLLWWLLLAPQATLQGMSLTGGSVGVEVGEQSAPATSTSVCDGLPGADPVQVGDLVDCFGGDRALLTR